ncbi:MAG TPA: hypothetical protein VER39_13320 [Nocardioidaceae bacterium]|nr:hypothetical protein [Nocardioidaceae bacterium]
MLRATTDLGPLIGLRVATLRGRSRSAAWLGLVALVLLTSAAVLGPTLLPDRPAVRDDLLPVLPVLYLASLGITVVVSMTSSGSRELLPREQAVAFPVSATTDHLGALLLAPLNLTWLLQAWAVLAATSYAVGARSTLAAALLPVLAWLVAATALAQVLAWGVEWLRRGAHGLLLLGTGTLLLTAAAAVTLLTTDPVAPLLDSGPARWVAEGVVAGAEGRWGPWSLVLSGLLVLTAVGLVLGGWTAGRVARRPARDERGADSAERPARPLPASDLAALLRTDRAGIYRSVPMRRGVAVLALLPAAVALLAGFGWHMLGIFPGLVASGAALLFGVNAWCLDGRGTVWRESLPVAPRTALAARGLVLAELILAASAVTLLVASTRAGIPTLSQLVAVLCAAVVVTVQVVTTSLRWSLRRPYAVDLRNPRATAAPPLVMVGYSSWLAVSTTTTGLLFNLVSGAPWWWSPLLAVFFLSWSGLRLGRVAAAWDDAGTRARVVGSVAV